MPILSGPSVRFREALKPRTQTYTGLKAPGVPGVGHEDQADPGLDPSNEAILPVKPFRCYHGVRHRPRPEPNNTSQRKVILRVLIYPI